MPSKQSARDLAKWRTNDSVYLDHTTLTEADLDWLAPAKRVTLWAVKVPDHFFGNLTSLEWLDVRGGTETAADFVRGCAALRFLQINQVRGMTDLSAVAECSSLEFLSLYGLPKVQALPSLGRLRRLARVEIGSMKGLATIAPVLDAPELRELVLSRTVGLDPADPERMRETPGLKEFEWFAEDVPTRVWLPVVEAVNKPNAKAVYPEDWFAQRG